MANLESFVKSAQAGGFSAAARRLQLTPAAVSRNVAMLERQLGVRLFQRSTRKLTLTEAGERLLAAAGEPLAALQLALAAVKGSDGEPAGLLKLSLAPSFGIAHVLPLLPAFRAAYPLVTPEWHFENRAVDLIAEGYDAAIGGGFELPPGVVARPLAPAHIVAVASPALLADRPTPREPAELADWDGIVMRSARSGRVRAWSFRDRSGREQVAPQRESLIVNDPAAMREAARLGLGVALLALPDALPLLDSGELVRLLPRWWADAGMISLYYASRRLMPAKTRVFIDFLTTAFARDGLAQRMSAA